MMTFFNCKDYFFLLFNVETQYFASPVCNAVMKIK